MVKKIIIFWILVMTITGAGFFLERTIAGNNDEEKLFKEVMPEAKYFSLKTGDIPYYQAFKSSGSIFEAKKTAGVIFHTKELFPQERGMIGPIDVLVGMDMQGRITGIKILSHEETPGIGSKIELPWFQNQFKQKGLSDRFIVDEDIDAVSGATISSHAVARVVKKGLLTMAGQLGILKEVEREPYFKIMARNIRKSSLPTFFLLSILVILGFTSKKGWLRNLTLLFGLWYLGFTEKAYVSFITFSNIMLVRFTPVSDYIQWYLLIVLVFIIAIGWGRIYCGWICPFGAIQEFLNRAPLKRDLPPKADGLLKYLKFLLLPIIITGLLITRDVSFGNYEPFATIFSFSGTPFHWAFLALVLILSLIISRPFCRYLCLIGAVQALISRWSLFKLRVKEDCNNCGLCVKSCPVGAISTGLKKVRINLFECIRCNRCAITCPHIENYRGGERGCKKEDG